MARITPTLKTPAPGICRCGCGETAVKNYRPGHDARHVGRLLADAKTRFPGVPDHEDAKARYAELPSPALQAKLYRAIDNAKRSEA